MRTACFFFVVLAVGCGAPVASRGATETPTPAEPSVEGGHAIRLSRPVAVGARFRQHTIHTRRQTRRAFVDERITQEETTERAVELIARTEVTEINTRGAAVVTIYTVERALLRDERGESEVVPPGSVIRVTRVPPGQGEGSIELIDGALSEGAAEALDIVLSTTVSPGGDDAVFGSDSPRREGESWPINVARAAQDMNKIPSITISADQVEGETRLERLDEVRGVPCLMIRGEMQAEGFAMAGLPPGSEVTVSRLRAVMTGAFPTDPSMGRIAATEEMEMRIQIRLPSVDGRSARMELRVEDSVQTEYER